MKKITISADRQRDSSILQNRPTPPQFMLSFAVQQLLTETSSATVNASLLEAETRRLTMSAVVVAAVTTDLRGYSHYGLND